MADEPNWNLNFVDFDDNSKSRFDVSKDDVDKLIAQQENENTKRKTTYDLNIVLKYLREVRKEDRELEEIPPQELNLFLSEFIIAARTKKGEQYEPSSLRGILTSFDRYLTRREYGKRLFYEFTYRNKRPQSMLEPDAPFYLTVNHFKSSVQGQQRDCTWFKAQPMGVNKLNSILKDMCEVGGIP